MEARGGITTSAGRGATTTCIVAGEERSALEAVTLTLELFSITVVGTAVGGEAALELIETEEPHVALVDLTLAQPSVVEISRQVRRTALKTSVLVHTEAAVGAGLTELLEAGVRGVVLRNAPLEEVARAVHVVAAGGLYIDPSLATQPPQP